MASARISSSHPGSFPSFWVRNSPNLRFKNVEPQRPPVPAAASLTLRIGCSWVIVYEIKSTVPPPASQRTKLSPMFNPCGSKPCRAYIAAASCECVSSKQCHWHFKLTGSETNNISDWDFKPAFWQALNVLSLATSVHIAGTVSTNSIGVVRRTAAPNFCSRKYIRCLFSSLR